MTDNNDNRDTGSIERIAAKLSRARKKNKLSLEKAAAQLRLPYGTLEMLESGHTETLGPPVYVRGYVTNYARLLGVDLSAADLASIAPEVIDEVPVVNLRPVHGRGRQLMDQYAKMASYLVATVVVVLPILWWGGTGLMDSIGVGQDAARGDSATTPKAQANQNDTGSAVRQTPGEELSVPSAPQGPMVASMTSMPSISNPPALEPVATDSPIQEILQDYSAAPDQDAPLALLQQPVAEEGEILIELRLQDDSWVELEASDGTRLEYNLLSGDSEHQYMGIPPIRVLIGNADAVSLSVDGQAYDLSAHRQGNLAMFELDHPQYAGNQQGSDQEP